MATVQFRGTREDIQRIANLIANILSGRAPDEQGVGKSFLLALGFAALSDIKSAYVVKADGGTDEMGIRWRPLSREYLAYGRRFGRGEQASLKRAAGLGSGHRLAPGGKKGLLTSSQLREWRKIYSSFLMRFMVSEGEAEAKSHAAAIAWTILKKRGARTKLEVFGTRKAQILRDTGVLLNSLSPGLLSGAGESASYSPPGGAGGDQIFDTRPGEVIVGTNVIYAGPHQKTRPFLPDERNPIPAVWWMRWVAVANMALVLSVEQLYRSKS